MYFYKLLQITSSPNLKSILHNNLAACYFKKLSDKNFQNKQNRKSLEHVQNITVKNCSHCIEYLHEENNPDNLKILNKAYYL